MTERAATALAFARRLAFPRYPGTEGDRRAIELVAAAFREAGLEVALEPFRYDIRPVFRLISAFLVTLAAFVATSGWVAATRPGLALGLLGAAFAIGGAILVWSPWLERLYAAPGSTETANVVGRRPARGPRRLTFVLLAHHDSKSQNLTMPVRGVATALALAGALVHGGGLVARLAFGAVPPAWLAPAAAGVAAAALLLLSTLRSGDLSPGGVDNAGSVGVLVALAPTLVAEVPADVELVVLSPGAEEDHMVGAMRWLEAHRDELAAHPVLALNLDGVGSPGRPVSIERYGLGRAFAPTLAPLAVAAARRLGLPLRRILLPPGLGVDAIPFASRGIECLTLASGRLGRATLAVHSRHDVADHLELASLERAVALTHAVVVDACRAEGVKK